MMKKWWCGLNQTGVVLLCRPMKVRHIAMAFGILFYGAGLTCVCAGDYSKVVLSVQEKLSFNIAGQSGGCVGC